MHIKSTPLHPLPAMARRDMLGKIAAFAAIGALGAGAQSVHAQAYPNRAIKMVVAYPPAGATDILARLVGQKIGDRLGQSVVIDNKPGAGSTLGMDIAARATPDGYNAFLCAVTTQAIASHLYPNAKSELQRHFVPAALIASAPHVLVVNNEVPARTMGEFAQWLKAHHKSVNYASQGMGTLSHLESELLCQHLGVKPTHTPYKGSSGAVTDLLSGTVSFMFDSVAASMPLVKSGKLRAIAVASSSRVPAMPELPTVAQAGIPGYEVDNWFGIYLPAGSPPEAVAAISKATLDVLRDPAVVESLVQKGYIVTPGDAAQLDQRARQDYARWTTVMKGLEITTG